MALSALALCSRALLRVGASTIASFDEGTAESEVAANLYPPLRDAVLSSHPWSFATTQTSLQRLVDEPTSDYGYAFGKLPDDFLRALSVGHNNGHGMTYRIVNKKSFCSAVAVDEVMLTYVYRPDESAFPPFFDQLLIGRLTAEFCIPITQSTARAQFLFRLAEDEFRRAKLIDAQKCVAAVGDFPLIEVES